MNINNLYTYKATCTNVVDRDTIDIILQLGFDTYAKGIQAYYNLKGLLGGQVDERRS